MIDTFPEISQNRRFIIDTVGIISYFHSIFDVSSKLSSRATKIIDDALVYRNSILIVPSIVFVEIFDKWFKGASASAEEFQARCRFEILERLSSLPNVEIRGIDEEVLYIYAGLHDIANDLENRDRLILATAIALNSPLITVDSQIARYVEVHNVIPQIIT